MKARIWIYITLAIFNIAVANAADAPKIEILTLNEAIVRVLEGNPQLKANDYKARAAAARIRQASLTRPLSVSIELENFSGSGIYEGSDALETTLSLVKLLELGDKPSLRGDVAQQEAALVQNEQDASRLDLLTEATKRFIHAAVDQERLRIAEDKLVLSERTYQAVEQRVRAGRSPVAERRRAAILRARAEIEREHADHELATSRVKLAVMWGAESAQFSAVQASLLDLETVDSFAQLKNLLDQNPDLIRFATSKRLAETRLHLAQAGRRGNIELSGGIRHFSRTDDNALMLSASIPIGLGSRATPHIEEARLLVDQNPLHYQQRKLALHASLFEVYQELSHAYTAVETLRQQIIPEAERALRDYEKGYRSGRYSLLELTEAQRTLLEARLEIIMSAANYHRFRIEIERLTGTPFASGVSQ